MGVFQGAETTKRAYSAPYKGPPMHPPLMPPHWYPPTEKSVTTICRCRSSRTNRCNCLSANLIERTKEPERCCPCHRGDGRARIPGTGADTVARARQPTTALAPPRTEREPRPVPRRPRPAAERQPASPRGGRGGGAEGGAAGGAEGAQVPGVPGGDAEAARREREAAGHLHELRH